MHRFAFMIVVLIVAGCVGSKPSTTKKEIPKSHQDKIKNVVAFGTTWVNHGQLPNGKGVPSVAAEIYSKDFEFWDYRSKNNDERLVVVVSPHFSSFLTYAHFVQANKDGKWVTNGKAKVLHHDEKFITASYQNGELDGELTLFSSTNVPWAKVHYKDGKVEGKVDIWFPNSKQKAIEFEVKGGNYAIEPKRWTPKGDEIAVNEKNTDSQSKKGSVFDINKEGFWINLGQADVKISTYFALKEMMLGEIVGPGNDVEIGEILWSKDGR